MSIANKKRILVEYYRKNGGFPLAAVTIDSDSNTVGNVFINGTWFGTFDYIEKKFIQKAE